MSWSTWSTFWSESDPIASRYLPDTVFYSESATGSSASDLANDLSQRNTDLSVGTNVVYEASSTRMLPTDERSYDWLVDLNDADTGYMISYGAQRVTITAGVVSLVVNSSTVLSHTISTIDNSDQRYLICVTSERNPLTTGASSAWVSTIQIFDVTNDVYEQTVGSHAAVSQTSTTVVLLGQNAGGTNAFTNRCYAIRVGTAFHSSVATRESFISNATAPSSLVSPSRRSILAPEPLAEDGEFAGPVVLRTAQDAAERDLWLSGPLVNEQYFDLVAHNGSRTASTEEWTQPDPAQAGRYLYLAYLYRRPVPLGCNAANVHVHYQQWRVSGSTDNLYITCHSMSQPGFAAKPPQSPTKLERYVVSSGALTSSHGTGSTAGAWLNLGTVRLARDNRGYTYLCLGFRVTDAGGSGSTDDQLWSIRSLVIEPVFETQSTGPGFGVGQ